MKNPTFPNNEQEIPRLFFKSIKNITLFETLDSKRNTPTSEGCYQKPKEVFNNLGIDFVG